jgi:hypothetical protein
MSDSNYDLGYLRASLDELKAYLLSKELFWPVSTPRGFRSFPMLTIGNLLLSIKKIKASSNTGQLSPEQRTEYAQLARKVDEIHHQWTAAWEAKSIWEFGSRLRQWGNYLNELINKEETHAVYYSSEVRVRVLLELLGEYASTADQEALAQLDEMLRAKLKFSDFIWSTELQPEFLHQDYWFLYGKI